MMNHDETQKVAVNVAGGPQNGLRSRAATSRPPEANT